MTYAWGTMDFLVRPPPVPKGAAAFASRAERAEAFMRHLLDTATDQGGTTEIAMPVTASVEGGKRKPKQSPSSSSGEWASTESLPDCWIFDTGCGHDLTSLRWVAEGDRECSLVATR